MNCGGDRRFVARLLEEGLDVAWLQALRSGPQPSAKSGISRGALRKLHGSGALRKAPRDRKGNHYWSAGPFLKGYLDLAVQLSEASR